MKNKLQFILGPCVIESESQLLNTAEKITEICSDLNIDFIFKASYDKANRTDINSYRGPGLKKGCEILKKVKKNLNLKILTDIHLPQEAEKVAEVADIIQIPAFLCRQTDVLVASAKTQKTINVKKGQFLTPWDVKNIANKLTQANCKDFFFTERGNCFGYGNLVVDMRSIYWIKEMGYKIIFDATHSVQKPGITHQKSEKNITDGDSKIAPYLASSAVACGCDGIFMEVHPNPPEALSDSANQIPINKLKKILQKLISIKNAINPFEEKLKN